MDGSSKLDETSRLTFSKVFFVGWGSPYHTINSCLSCLHQPLGSQKRRQRKTIWWYFINTFHSKNPPPPSHWGWIINHYICCRVPPFCQRLASTDETTFCLFTVSLVAMFVRILQPKKISPFSCQLRDRRQKGFNTLSSHSRNSLKQCWALDCVHSGHLRAAAAHQELGLANLEARWRSDVTLAAE